jgi:hypothetical protein
MHMKDRPKNTIPCPHCGHAINARYPRLSSRIPKETLLACPHCRQMFTISEQDLAAARSNFFADYIVDAALFFVVALTILLLMFWILVRCLTPV